MQKWLQILLFSVLGCLTGCARWPSHPIENYYAHDLPPPSGNVWDRLRVNFSWPCYTDKKAVQIEIQYYKTHPKDLEHMAERAKPYLYHILTALKEKNLPAELALLPFVESAYNPLAHSGAGAKGLWQIMPKTAHLLKVPRNRGYDGRLDLIHGTRAALAYFARLRQEFSDQWLLVLAAYDAGEGTVLRALHNRKNPTSDDYWHLQLPRETERYVPKFLAILALIEKPQQYGVKLPFIRNEPHLLKVRFRHPMRLQTLAELSGLSLKTLKQYNAGFHHQTTGRWGPYRVLLPQDRVLHFKKALKRYERTQVQVYQVVKGDTLSEIAHRYHIPTQTLRTFNHLSSNRIRIKQTLKIPPPVRHHIKTMPKPLKKTSHTKKLVSQSTVHL